MTFRILTLSTVPVKSRKYMAAAKEKYGFIPNMAGIMAESTPLLDGYLQLERCAEQTSFSRMERAVICLAVSYRNDAAYCMSAHTRSALDIPLRPDIVESLRTGAPVQDEKLEALRRYTIGVMENGGRPPDAVKEKFLGVGYRPVHALEIVLIIAFKTLSNYTNRLAHTALDREFEATAWALSEVA